MVYCYLIDHNHHVRRDLKKRRYEGEGAKVYREAKTMIQNAVKEDWIGVQCDGIETCQNKNNSN